MLFTQSDISITSSQDDAVLDGSFSLDPIDFLGVPQTYDYFEIPDLFLFEDLCPESTSEVIVSGALPTYMGALEATAAPPETDTMDSPQYIPEVDTHYSEPYFPLPSPGLSDAVSVPAYYPQDVHYAFDPVPSASPTRPHDDNIPFCIDRTFALVFFSLAPTRAHAAELPLHARSSPKTSYSFHELEAMIAKGSHRCPVDDCDFTPASGKRDDLVRHIKTHCEDKGEEWSRRVAGTCKPFEYGGQMRVGGCLLSFSRKDALGRHVRDSKKCVWGSG
ncbi:hypothetical protein IEO21_04808 [Rhodonia placenta]|uniref:Uncharacterized protein n=1 Tax=Rhodonia placenta TaxID=104341 RepID=A0A8H7U2W9_9APHY|nr:hypothetical protein IEO21_04808 [Postia placenta]